MWRRWTTPPIVQNVRERPYTHKRPRTVGGGSFEQVRRGDVPWTCCCTLHVMSPAETTCAFGCVLGGAIMSAQFPRHSRTHLSLALV